MIKLRLSLPILALAVPLVAAQPLAAQNTEMAWPKKYNAVPGGTASPGQNGMILDVTKGGEKKLQTGALDELPAGPKINSGAPDAQRSTPADPEKPGLTAAPKVTINGVGSHFDGKYSVPRVTHKYR